MYSEPEDDVRTCGSPGVGDLSSCLVPPEQSHRRSAKSSPSSLIVGSCRRTVCNVSSIGGEVYERERHGGGGGGGASEGIN